MPSTPVDVTHSKKKNLLFTIATLVTRMDEYLEMVDSALQSGFDRDDVEFIYIDNSSGNQFDGFSGTNHFIARAAGQYLIICHQDVLFDQDRCEQLIEKINELSALDANWAIAGNAGKQVNSSLALRISDPHGENVTVGDLPAEVVSLDENFIIINTAANVGCTRNIAGFHLYGTDLCFNAMQRGYKCYVIDFHLTHKSVGVVTDAYHQVKQQIIENYARRKESVVIQSMCSRFYVSSSRIRNILLNRKSLLNLHSSLSKKKSKQT
ncbi:acyl esterase [Ketobacter sp. MCCC 1A13808]|uniref:acyl esterase n=1 Tax=Ketobacter sp. MCCC 1A13808 TaxID=2602738 RepID=UPI0012EC26CD|nr:acyl esterase [Ketobacter sp. MCCC 1A13808]MVF11748.1 acyl esterase [Ketobacter sp. MCCC 1A13808]